MSAFVSSATIGFEGRDFFAKKHSHINCSVDKARNATNMQYKMAKCIKVNFSSSSFDSKSMDFSWKKGMYLLNNPCTIPASLILKISGLRESYGYLLVKLKSSLEVLRYGVIFAEQD